MTTTDGVLALLEESGLAADDELGALLADLQTLGTGPAPAPGPELAALLVADGRPRRLHRRGALVGALVVLSLGTGVTAAAASPDVRDGAVGAVAAVVHVLRPPAVAEHPARLRTPTPVGVPAARVPVSSGPEPSTTKRADVPAVVPGRSSRSGDDHHASGADDSVGRSTGASDGRGSSGSSGSHDATGSGSGSGSHDGTASGSGSSSGSSDGTGHGSSGGSTGDSLQSGTGSPGSGGHDDGDGSHHASGDGSGDDSAGDG